MLKYIFTIPKTTEITCPVQNLFKSNNGSYTSTAVLTNSVLKSATLLENTTHR